MVWNISNYAIGDRVHNEPPPTLIRWRAHLEEVTQIKLIKLQGKKLAT
jgi:hypothetical protein